MRQDSADLAYLRDLFVSTTTMRHAALILFFVLATPAYSKAPREFAAWVPQGWELLTTAAGDLNRDGVDDAVLVIEEANPAKRKSEPLDAHVLNLNPRRVIILFNTTNGYRQIFSRDDLLPSEHEEDNPCLTDPLVEGGVSVKRGTLVVELQYWMSCGSYGVANNKFTFRFDNERFRLIGYDTSEFSRSTGEQSGISINYLTSKKKITTGANVLGASKPKVTWKSVPSKREFYLDDISLNCNADHEVDWCP